MEAEGTDVLDNLVANLRVLPRDAVEQIAKYVGGLKEEFDDIKIVDASALRPLEDEEFIGIWADRTDMTGSSGTIRRLRRG